MDPVLEERLQRAVQKHQQGKVAEAQSEYEAVTAAYPDAHEAWHLLGVCRQQAGDDQGAIAALNRAISLDG